MAFFAVEPSVSLVCDKALMYCACFCIPNSIRIISHWAYWMVTMLWSLALTNMLSVSCVSFVCMCILSYCIVLLHVRICCYRGMDLSLFITVKYALFAGVMSGEYTASLRQKPNDPLLHLVIGLAYLHLASQKFSSKRHLLVTQVWLTLLPLPLLYLYYLCFITSIVIVSTALCLSQLWEFLISRASMNISFWWNIDILLYFTEWHQHFIIMQNCQRLIRYALIGYDLCKKEIKILDSCYKMVIFGGL